MMTKRQDEAQAQQARESQQRVFERAAQQAEADAPPARTRDDVIRDMQETIGGLGAMSPSGVEAAAAKLTALLSELQGMQRAPEGTT